ncbi:MAG: MBL fold metallo-hydrolase [Clostridia bacterium]|nr:MBL fold metallo-hydrolase [Clostridia bacterium]
MRIENGVEMLELSISVMGKANVVYPTLIWDEGQAILVDTGYPGQLNQIRKSVEETGLAFERLNKVIVTHHDLDHIGSLADIIRESSGKVEVLSHEKEKPYIQGEMCPQKLSLLEAKLETLTAETKAIYEGLKAGFEKSKAPVSRTIIDSEELPYCGGITVIYTPGHTTGHISLYHKQSKILIPGDLLFVEDGLLIAAPKFTNYDQKTAMKSLEKLTEFDIEKVICYHGGLYGEQVNQRILELIQGE